MVRLSKMIPGGADAAKPKKTAWMERGAPVDQSEDLERILELPRREPLDIESPRAAAMVAMMTERFSRGPRECRCREIDPSRSKCITELLPLQAWSLYEMGLAGGLLASIFVGGGKTIIGILASIALRSHSALLLVPPSLVAQLWTDYRVLAEHFRVPSIIFEGHPYTNIIEGEPSTLRVLPYSLLSSPKQTDWVSNLKPDLIIADECDKLKIVDGSGSSRIVRYLAEDNDVRFCGWTGSMTDKSIREFAHLAAFALKLSSPLPLDPDAVEDWARYLDPVNEPCPAGALKRLMNDFDEDAHDGFRRRFSETLGVITSETASVIVDGGTDEVRVSIAERPAPKIPPEVEAALVSVRNYVRPDGEELIDELSRAKTATEVACGLYYRWKFNGEPEDLIEEWLAARKKWNKELRLKLQDRREFLDSPLLCTHAAQRFYGERPRVKNLPIWEAVSWPRWKAVKDLVKPQTEAVRISDYLVRDAIQWATENTGIVWYQMVEFGQWVSQLSGLPLLGGGKKGAEALARERGNRSIIASIKSHGRGRNGLQRLFSKQLVANIPASATAWEQLLGRLVRREQKEAEVSTELYKHTPELRKAINQALRRAEYVRSTLGATQLLSRGGIERDDIEDEDETPGEDL